MESKDVSAAERYKRALEEAGGDAVIRKYSTLSRELTENMETGETVSQALEYQLLDIDRLYEEAKCMEDSIQDFAKEIASLTNGKFLPAKLKSKDRAAFKSRIKYGNDLSRLMDIQRCTVEFSDIATMYKGIATLKKKNYFSKEHRVSARIISFEDRFQIGQRLTDGYCDIQLLLMVDEHVSEMQMNVASMLRAKHMGGHRAYRSTRERNERLLMASIKNEFSTETPIQRDEYEGFSIYENVGVKRLLQHGANPNAVKDKTGRSALHYAARHGNVKMIDALLEKNADCFSLDRSYSMPLHRSLIHRHLDATRVLLNKMIFEMNMEIRASGCKKKMMEDSKERSLSKSDKKFVDEYNRKKHFLKRSLAGTQ